MKRYYFWYVLFFWIGCLYAQQGKLDEKFNVIDNGLLGDGFDATVQALLVQSDNKLIVGGNFNNFNGTTATKICRLDASGQIDPTFLSGSGFNDNVYCMLSVSNSASIIGGNFTSYNGHTVSKIIKIDENGTLDATFSTNLGTVTSGIVHTLAKDKDDRILVGGTFTKIKGVTTNRIARLLSDGTLDASFIIGTGASHQINTIAVQSDNKILVGGNFTTFSGISKNRIIRLNSDGSIDSSFNQGTGFDNDVEKIVVQPDGKIVVGGNFTIYNGISANKIIRLNSDGSIDATFLSGTGFNGGIVYALALDSAGNIRVGGSFNGSYNGSSVNRLVCLQSNGVLKGDFDMGAGPSSYIYDIAQDNDGFWYLGGNFSTYDNLNQGRVTKINDLGVLEDGYLTSNVGFNLPVLKVIPLSNKKVIAAGSFKKFNGADANFLVCLNEDGTLDASFNSGQVGADNSVRSVLLLPNQKLIVGGDFKNYNGVVANRIVALNVDGTFDTSVNFGVGFNNQVYTITRQIDGKLLIGGNFTSFNNETSNRIIRLNADGSRDTSFVCDGADKYVEEIIVQSDGKIIVVGRFDNFNGISSSRIVRLNANGSTDTSFNVGAGFGNNIYAAALQEDGKIVVGGSFLTYKSVTQKRIARLNSDGSLDSSFAVGTGFSNGDIRSILIQKDGRILIGGAFSGNYNGTAVSRLLRLQKNGILDTSFSVNLNGTLYAMAFTVDNKLMIGGNFNSISGKAKHRIARLRLCVNSSVFNGNWSNGTASEGMELRFDENYQFANSLMVCNCTIAEGKTVIINSDQTLSLDFDLTGLGTLVLKNTASLFQEDNEIVNTGKVVVEKISAPMKNNDYTYWSSPVSNQLFKELSPNTYATNYYHWNNGWIFWKGAMKLGKGYICSVPRPGVYSNGESAFEANAVTYEQPVEFKGVPNNGIITGETTLSNRNYLVGNPYPSAIDADAFLEANSFLNGTIYLWTHNTPIQFSNGTAVYNPADYALYNKTGGVITSPNGILPTGKIASGQSFFVLANTAGTISFSNAMRVKNQNNLFYKFGTYSKSSQEKNKRLWLNLTNDKELFKQLLIGYVSGATNEFDSNFDGVSLNGNALADFYSISNNKKYTIQGKAYPFEVSDEIPLGFTSQVAGNLSIEIADEEGFAADNAIYIEDKLNSTLHDLQKGAYTFQTLKGTFNDRFVLRFQNNLKVVNSEKVDPFRLFYKERLLHFSSESEVINKVGIYDLSGKRIACIEKLNTNEWVWKPTFSAPKVVLVKVKLASDKVITQKVMLY